MHGKQYRLQQKRVRRRTDGGGGVGHACRCENAIAALPEGARDDYGGFGQAVFNVEVAADDASRAQGLMHVAHMPMSKGMLFVYDQPQQLAFWMRNTLIELDMLFLDDFGEIKHIHHRAQPLDETVISPGTMKLKGVLEINGGLALRMGIATGDTLRHPAFVSRDTPWECGS